jgi:hypothetical protein
MCLMTYHDIRVSEMAQTPSVRNSTQAGEMCAKSLPWITNQVLYVAKAARRRAGRNRRIDGTTLYLSAVGEMGCFSGSCPAELRSFVTF